MRVARVSCSLAILVLAAGPAPSQEPSSYEFDGAISRSSLEAYLLRSATTMGLLGSQGRNDDLRMALNTGLKFAGRALTAWGSEAYHVSLLQGLGPKVAMIHSMDPEMILQGTVFEIITTSVNDVAIPPWAFEEFGLPVEERNFRYEAMIYPDGRLVDHWSRGASVPDITQLETRMWIYFMGRLYVDAGFEAIHLGQIELMGQNDRDHSAWADVLNRIRAYARDHARRHLMLFDGHVPSHGFHYEGDKLLLDFHSFPLRPISVAEEPQKAVLRMGHLDTLYGRSLGGLTPSGWRCDSLPYLVEVDNFGTSDREGEPTQDYFVWGYDEMCWFAKQPEEYRNEWLAYAVEFLRENDPNGFLEMPFSRCLASPADGQTWYYGNTRAPGTPHGFSVERTVKALWGHVAYDCRDAYLEGGAYLFGEGSWLNASEEPQGMVPAGSLAARVPEGGTWSLTWTAPEPGWYVVAGTVGPAEAAFTLTVDGGDQALAVEGHEAMQGFRHVAELGGGDAVRLEVAAPENTDVPFMLVISRR